MLVIRTEIRGTVAPLISPFASDTFLRPFFRQLGAQLEKANRPIQALRCSPESILRFLEISARYIFKIYISPYLLSIIISLGKRESNIRDFNFYDKYLSFVQRHNYLIITIYLILDKLSL